MWLCRHLDNDVYGRKIQDQDCESPGNSLDTEEEWAPAGKWVRPLTSLEVLFAVGNVNTAQVLYLEHSSPLTLQLVHHALTILAE